MAGSVHSSKTMLIKVRAKTQIGKKCDEPYNPTTQQSGKRFGEQDTGH